MVRFYRSIPHEQSVKTKNYQLTWGRVEAGGNGGDCTNSMGFLFWGDKYSKIDFGDSCTTLNK